MTATITEHDTLEITTPEFDEPIPCEDLSPYEDCDNPAVYDCRTACCGTEIPLCESCLFYFVEWASQYIGKAFVCIHCSTEVPLNPNHLIVIGRIK